jgi:hypothetical protein
MKKSQLKELIKELYLQEYSLNEEEQENEDENLSQEEPSPEDMEIGEDNKKQIQNTLTDALEASKKLGDDTLSTQIGNTITYFTREHILGGE